jgi:pimeloyl-ACP methyl ester carboxylesterase
MALPYADWRKAPDRRFDFSYGETEMRTQSILLIAVCCSLLLPVQPVSAQNTKQEVNVPNSIEARFRAAISQACQDRGAPAYCRMLSLARRQAGPDIAWYEALFKVGPDKLDVIKLHRVVAETHIGVSETTSAALMYVHGSGGRFDSDFIVSDTAPWLAASGIDVWGIDLRQANVPADNADFSAMATWDYARLIDDIRLATRFVRYVRQLTGQQFGRINLIGWSLGASLTIATANEEAVITPEERDLKGIVSIDTIYRHDPTNISAITSSCQREAAQRQVLAQGTFQIDNRTRPRVGELALSLPSEPSPFMAGYTNLQYGLNFGCQNSMPPFPFHLAACTYDSSGKPSDAANSIREIVFRMFAAGNSFNSRPAMATYFAIPCGSTTRYWDHLAEIRIPLLSVGIAGGFGPAAFETSAYLPNSAITTLWLQNLPDTAARSDIGHMEALSSMTAKVRVWEPVRTWLLHNEQAKERDLR